MKTIKRIVVGLLLFFLFELIFVSQINAQTLTQVPTKQKDYLPIHVFGSKTCPHCSAEKEFLKLFKAQRPDQEMYFYYINEAKNYELLIEIGKKIDVSSQAVPITIVGKEHFVGFGSSETTGRKLVDLIEKIKDSEQKDIVQDIINSSDIKIKRETIKPIEVKATSVTSDSPSDAEIIDLPVLGKVNIQHFSLPFLTVVLGLADGFNPCAMWSLLFLISLLIKMENRRRMWLLGSVFIVVSGLVYLLFMSAWLSIFMFFAYISWIRILIAMIAIFVGYLYLKEFVQNKTGECEVDLGGKKQQVFNKLKVITYNQNLLLALIGISIIAFAVNLLEGVCSSGLPAIYTSILSTAVDSHLKRLVYMFSYILFYMLDDLVVFILAMKTLHMVGLDTKYARWSRLVGGIILILIGIILIIKPGLLSFNV